MCVKTIIMLPALTCEYFPVATNGATNEKVTQRGVFTAVKLREKFAKA